MKRIAVNTRLLVPNKTDGIARFTIEIFERLVRNHPEIEFTFIFDRNEIGYDFGKNAKHISLFPPARHPILWYWWFEISLKRYLNNNDFDLFISPEGWIPPNLKIPSLSVIHDLNFIHLPQHVAYSHRKFLQHFFPKYAKRASRIATVSNYSRSDISKSFNIPAEKIDLVYNGVNSEFSPATEEEQLQVKKKFTFDKDFFIFIGTVHPRKNLDNLFKAFDIFKKNTEYEHKLLIVGNRKWWPQELEAIYSTMKFREDVIFTGRLEDKELSTLLSGATALTYLPHFEGFGIPLLEAFACKTAVITANNTSLPEVTADAAILCNSNDASEIAKAMEEIAKNDSLKKELIHKGTNQLKRFSWDESAKKLFQSILNCKPEWA